MDFYEELAERIYAKTGSKYSDTAYIKRALEVGKADYATVNEYAVKLGKTYSSVINDEALKHILENGFLDPDFVEAIGAAMQDMMEDVAYYSRETQALLNSQANIGIAVQDPGIDIDRINGIKKRLLEEPFEDIDWITKSPFANAAQAAVDDVQRANVKKHYQMGLSPMITRTLDNGHACKWCKGLAGTYKYPNELPSDIYRRHENCTCVVTYVPVTGKKQNVWTKQYS